MCCKNENICRVVRMTIFDGTEYIFFFKSELFYQKLDSLTHVVPLKSFSNHNLMDSVSSMSFSNNIKQEAQIFNWEIVFLLIPQKFLYILLAYSVLLYNH